MSKIISSLTEKMFEEPNGENRLPAAGLKWTTNYEDLRWGEGEGCVTILSLECSFGTRQIIDNRNPKEAKDYIAKDMKRQVQELVFGEFRDAMMELRYAIYKRDGNRAMDLWQDINERMFSE